MGEYCCVMTFMDETERNTFVRYEDVTVYEKLNVVKIGNRLFERSFGRLFSNAVLDEYEAEQYELWLSSEGAFPSFFAVPKNCGAVSIFNRDAKVLGMMSSFRLGEHPNSQHLLLNGCLRVIQRAAQSFLLRKEMERFELAVLHPKSKLRWLFGINKDIEIIIQYFYYFQ